MSARSFKSMMIHLKIPYFGMTVVLMVLAANTLQAKDIVIATSSMTLTSVPYLVAIEKGFFEKEGLTAQYVVMRSDLAVKGLITGDVDYNQSVSSVLRAGVAGAPLITVAGIYNRTFFELIARRDIKSLAELKGKTVGISRYGASTSSPTIRAQGQRHRSRQADKDPSSRRRCRPIAGLQNGTLAAIVSQVPANFFAHKVGGHTLLPLGEYMETLLAGAGVSQKKLEQNRDEVKRGVRALLRSLDFMQTQPVEVKV